MATLAEFPDRQLLGEDVIWCGDEDRGHPLLPPPPLTKATHSHPGDLRRCHRHPVDLSCVIADCAAINDQIDDEWMVRDQGAIVRQLGWEPKAYAADLIESEGGPEHCVKPITPENDVLGTLYRARQRSR